jgi:hypothetical protein
MSPLYANVFLSPPLHPNRENVRMLLRFTLSIVIALTLIGIRPSDADAGKIGGVGYADYYYVASADDTDPGQTPEKQNAFRMRRLYLTYNQNVSERFDVRFRLEANDAGFGKTEKMVPFVKHGYLKWKGALGGSLYLGLSGTPTWGISESYWGYRSVEKTILDLNGIGSSADVGVGLTGAAGALDYHVMVGNGPGQRPETDNGKKFYGSLSTRPSDALVLEVYADLDLRPADQNRLTAKGFAGIQSGGLRLGVEPFIRINSEADTGGDDETITGASIFASLPMGDHRAFGRFDLVSNDDADTSEMFVLAGYDWTVEKGLHIIPNVHIQLPDGPDPNIQARVTAYYKF